MSNKTREGSVIITTKVLQKRFTKVDEEQADRESCRLSKKCQIKCRTRKVMATACMEDFQ